LSLLNLLYFSDTLGVDPSSLESVIDEVVGAGLIFPEGFRMATVLL